MSPACGKRHAGLGRGRCCGIGVEPKQSDVLGVAPNELKIHTKIAVQNIASEQVNAAWSKASLPPCAEYIQDPPAGPSCASATWRGRARREVSGWKSRPCRRRPTAAPGRVGCRPARRSPSRGGDDDAIDVAVVGGVEQPGRSADHVDSEVVAPERSIRTEARDLLACVAFDVLRGMSPSTDATFRRRQVLGRSLRSRTRTRMLDGEAPQS